MKIAHTAGTHWRITPTANLWMETVATVHTEKHAHAPRVPVIIVTGNGAVCVKKPKVVMCVRVTFEKIKKALIACEINACAICPFEFSENCMENVIGGAIDYIHRLERDRAEMMQAIIDCGADCEYCLNARKNEEYCERYDGDCKVCTAQECKCKYCRRGSHFEWHSKGENRVENMVNTFDLNVYQRMAARTSNTDGADKICNGCLGLAGETGEVVDLYKKHRFQGHELDKEKMVEELGDVLWYVAEIASGLGVELGEVARRNVEKLRKRYPDGFEAEKSVNREG